MAAVFVAIVARMLAINGEKDLQAAPKENLDGIAAALKEGGNKDFSIVVLPRMNHLFQTSSTGLPTEYGEIEETFSGGFEDHFRLDFETHDARKEVICNRTSLCACLAVPADFIIYST